MQIGAGDEKIKLQLPLCSSSLLASSNFLRLVVYCVKIKKKLCAAHLIWESDEITNAISLPFVFKKTFFLFTNELSLFF